MRVVYLVAPDGFDDPARPSGGNGYDLRLVRDLPAYGWRVEPRPAHGPWSSEPPTDSASALVDALDDIPDRAVVLVDALVAVGAGQVIAAAAARLHLVALVHLPLGASPGSPPSPRQAHPDEEALLSSARAVVVTSEWSRDWLLGTYGIAPVDVVVARPGVEPIAATPPRPDGGRILCVAALTPAKGHLDLVDALSRLTELAWECVCVGPVDRDPVHTRELHTRIEDLGLASRIHFTGVLSGDRLEAQYASSDLLVLPSQLETYGMVVTEALAHGIPVVATEVGGVREALDDGRDGSLTPSGAGAPGGDDPGTVVPAGDVDALSRALRAWLTDPVLRDRWRRAAQVRRHRLTPWASPPATVARALQGAAA